MFAVEEIKVPVTPQKRPTSHLTTLLVSPKTERCCWDDGNNEIEMFDTCVNMVSLSMQSPPNKSSHSSVFVAKSKQEKRKEGKRMNVSCITSGTISKQQSKFDGEKRVRVISPRRWRGGIKMSASTSQRGRSRDEFSVNSDCTPRQLASIVLSKYKKYLEKNDGSVESPVSRTTKSKRARQFLSHLPSGFVKNPSIRWNVFIANSGDRIDRSYPPIGRDTVLSDLGRTNLLFKWRPWCDGLKTYAFEFPMKLLIANDEEETTVIVDYVGWDQLRKTVFSRISKRHSHPQRSSSAKRVSNDIKRRSSGSPTSRRAFGNVPRVLISWMFPDRTESADKSNDSGDVDVKTGADTSDRQNVEARDRRTVEYRARLNSSNTTDTSDGEMATEAHPRRPQWIPDSASQQCMFPGCSHAFSKVPFSPSRKHHCRACGILVCRRHSRNRVPLSSLGYQTPVRVCDKCFKTFSKSADHPKFAPTLEI
eukprot:g1162.t1